MFRFVLLFPLLVAPSLAADEPDTSPLKAPANWAGETIALPPGFARDMSFRGVEHIRFAPGMFDADSEAFFSYAFVFELPSETKLTETVIREEFLKYYRGLCVAVLDGKRPDVDPSTFTFELKSVKPDTDAESTDDRNDAATPSRYTATLNWVEPFVTQKPQQLQLDIHTGIRNNRSCLFACVSPNPRDTPIWAALHSIREGYLGKQQFRRPESSDWPRFRGPGGMGVSDAANLPLNWSESANLVWKQELPGGGSSSPVVFGDHIYLTTWSGYLVPGEDPGKLDDLQRHLVCLDRESGDIRWNRAVPARLPEEERIRDHGYAANTPAADARGVIAFFGKSGVHAFDHEGNLNWTADVGTDKHGWGTSASPLLYNDLVIINASVESQSLIALDRSTGREVWRTDGIREAWNTPIVVTTNDGREELVIAIFGKVLGLDPATGTQLWFCDTDITWYMVPTVVAADGIVYCLGGRSGTAGLAVRAGGRGDVTATHRLWTSIKGSNVTSPVFHDGHLYWMHEKIGIAYCATAETGALVYEERVSRAGQIYASALLADGRIYYTNRSGTTFVVPARPEFQLLATNELNDGTLFNASPAVTGNRILIRSDKYLYCLGD